MAAIVVLAKEPVAGKVKTRLCPPLSLADAAALAKAALLDTLEAVAAVDVRRVLAIDGAWVAPGFEVVRQGEGDLGERIAAALETAGVPALAIGMDTPQVTPALLASALAALERADAVLGPAQDGGYWAVGLRRPVPGAFAGVPMSAPITCAAQRTRFASLDLRVAELPTLRDVDRPADVRAVAAAAPRTRFARALVALERARAWDDPALARRLGERGGADPMETP